MTEAPIIWKGRELRTMGQTMDAVIEIAKSGSADEAIAFMEAYEKIAAPDVVRKNIGFGAGYYAPETAELIFQVFNVRHPIFGRNMAVDPAWALELGMRRATGGKPPEKTGG